MHIIKPKLRLGQEELTTDKSSQAAQTWMQPPCSKIRKIDLLVL